ncbi:MAG: hypothetical protein KGL39_26560 [Patescibacteria group bacterium]|nr:hypothetical protein [Patescibacteria group bacterium]
MRRVRGLVVLRDEGICQWCGERVTGLDMTEGNYSLQHRRARGMGGSSRPETDLPGNLVLVHGSGTTGCHGHIESHREEAARRGFILPQPTSRTTWVPADVPILVRNSFGYAWELRDDLGGRDLRVNALDAVAMLQLVGAISLSDMGQLERDAAPGGAA